ncbi:ribonuclease Z [Pustulibacterium marinum]|uniref:Ribonuclease Z n=1 Tax=Pustulibacterium marinum TaxID=1224947 RepID=A0A1I7G2W0_9FLAO|nr:ribonuclease Z [Pustulibacterium marinum]SFU42782.1 ribonuclease Z [Pustulibacterium marinum]
MKVTILGCYSATPRTLNNPTAQVLEINNRIFLIDCGEGTQVQLRKNKIKFNRIKHVFISHLHGDHFFGLPGLVSTFQMLGRETELHIYGPKGIKEAILLYLKLGNSYTTYPLYFHELTSKDSEVILDDERVTVQTIPLSHRVYTNGFLFTEKPKERKLDINAVLNYEIDKCYYQNIKNGKDVTLEDGTVISNEKLTFDPPSAKSYAFCSDTKYKPDIIPLIKGVTALYHEATFLDKHKHLCEHTKHSTAKQAGMIASEAEAKNLILGHYSTRYDGQEAFKEEAAEVFPSVALAQDGKVFEF